MDNVYHINFGTGKLEPVDTGARFPLGARVSYQDQANPKQVAVVVSEDVGQHTNGQECIFVDDFHTSHILPGSIERPGGWNREDGTATPEEIADLQRKAAEKLQARAETQERLRVEREAATARGKALLDAKRPAWAKAVIVASRVEDKSDLMTDYHGSTAHDTVIIAWSKHTRDLFAEMRKAAATFPETAHMGPGCDIYRARVVLVDDVNSNGGAYYAGNESHWHHELYGEGRSDPRQFSTEAEARAFVEGSPEPEPITFQVSGGGSQVVNFAWDISRESVEHREKYSMGHGFYLKAGCRNWDGWEVSKQGLGYGYEELCCIAGNGGYKVPEKGARKAPGSTPETPAQPGATVTENEEKNGVELRFPSKPGESIRADLKAHGWRWSRFGKCWYKRRTPEALAYAHEIAGKVSA